MGPLDAHRAAMDRAYRDMIQIAEAIEALPPRLQRKIIQRSRNGGYRLDPGLIKNDAERIMDTRMVYSAFQDGD